MTHNKPGVIIPLVRVITPHTIAQELTSVQPMTNILDPRPLETGTLETDSGATWYWVQPATAAALDFTDPRNSRAYWESVEQWCEDSFGPRNPWADPDDPGRWCASNCKYYFLDPADRTAFILRWS